MIAETAEHVSEAVNATTEAPYRGNLKPGVIDSEKMKAARLAKRAAWSPVRQPSYVLGRFHKAVLAHHGIGRIPDAEPATVPRLRQLLRRAGVSQEQAQVAVGCTLSRYLALNPRWPLWHTVAAVLETYDLTVADAVLASVQATDE